MQKRKRKKEAFSFIVSGLWSPLPILSTLQYVEAYEHMVPGVQENEFHVQAGSEHEHIAVELDLSYCAGGERVTNSHQTHVLITAVKRRHV